jgi:AcrR family transcriptional regulator
MPVRHAKERKPRPQLSAESVFRAAIHIADEEGIGALSMRRLAELLGVEAMSLYHHVADKDAILDGVVDLVFAEIEPPHGDDWKAAMRARAGALREALRRHPWAVGLLESRKNPGLSTMHHHDAVLGCLRGAGFSVEMAAHAYSLIDAYAYGFALQEQTLPFDTTKEPDDVAKAIIAQTPADRFPHIAEMAREHVLKPGYVYAHEFAFGLDLILDGLEARAPRRAGQRRR